jgi:hypothetical protein
MMLLAFVLDDSVLGKGRQHAIDVVLVLSLVIGGQRGRQLSASPMSIIPMLDLTLT